MSKIIYDLGNGKVKQLSNSSFDSNTNTLSVQGISSSAVTLNLPDGIIFSDNKILSSSAGADGQIISWDNTNSRWAFRDFQKLPTVSTAIPAGSDVTGSYLTNAQVKSLSNVVSGVLPVSRGGTGLTTADFNSLNVEAILVSDGSDKLAFKQSSDDSTKPSVVAQLTASSAVDGTDNQNKIVLVKGAIADAPAALFGSTKSLSSSYDGVAGNYTGYIEFNEGYKGDFTVECWTYLRNVGSHTDPNSRCTVLLTNNNFAINCAGASQNGTSGYYGLYTTTADYVTDLAFLPNQWVHLALVRTGSKIKLYANGTGSAQEYGITNSNIAETNKMYIGSNGIVNWNINGYLADFCFTKYAKTAAEITTYYNAVLAGTQGRHSKDEQNLSATSRIQSALTINDSTGQKTNVTQGRGVSILPSSIFNYYY